MNVHPHPLGHAEVRTKQEAWRRAGVRRLATVLAVWVLAIHSGGLAQEDHGAAGHVHAPAAALGIVDFQVGCDETVRADFDRALATMHHMMYVEARAMFEAIAAAEPDCGMAQWGVATTLFQPLWPSRPDASALQRGWELMERAATAPASERDALLIEATRAFFAEPDTAEYWQRVDRWAQGMAVAYGAFGEDRDVAALYALSRIAVAPRAADRSAAFTEAETVLRSIFEIEPMHPGAIHYSIHATDVENRAGNALDAVGTYGGIAPEVPHALHMPTHIYVRLGAWPDVIAWNRRSADAALTFPMGERVSLHHAHALDYMMYAHLQRGDDAMARAALEEALEAHYAEDFASAYHMAIMPARMAVERRAWQEAAQLEVRQPAYLAWDRYSWPQAISWFARGLGATHSGHIDAAREAEGQMKVLRDQSRAAGEQAFSTYIEIDRLILEGLIALSGGDEEMAVTRLREAAELEGTVDKHPVTPGTLLPPYEALGDVLSELGRHEEALAAYEASDARWPGRFHTLLGATRAAMASGNSPSAQGYARRLLDIAGASDRSDVLEVRAIAGE